MGQEIGGREAASGLIHHSALLAISAAVIRLRQCLLAKPFILLVHRFFCPGVVSSGFLPSMTCSCFQMRLTSDADMPSVSPRHTLPYWEPSLLSAASISSRQFIFCACSIRSRPSQDRRPKMLFFQKTRIRRRISTLSTLLSMRVE